MVIINLKTIHNDLKFFLTKLTNVNEKHDNYKKCIELINKRLEIKINQNL